MAMAEVRIFILVNANNIYNRKMVQRGWFAQVFIRLRYLVKNCGMPVTQNISKWQWKSAGRT